MFCPSSRLPCSACPASGSRDVLLRRSTCVLSRLLPAALVSCCYIGFEGDVFYSVAKFNQKNRENLTADMKDLMAESTNALVVDVSTQHYAKRYLA